MPPEVLINQFGIMSSKDTSDLRLPGGGMRPLRSRASGSLVTPCVPEARGSCICVGHRRPAAALARPL